MEEHHTLQVVLLHERQPLQMEQEAQTHRLGPETMHHTPQVEVKVHRSLRWVALASYREVAEMVIRHREVDPFRSLVLIHELA